MRLKILPYHWSSLSAVSIARALGCKKISLSSMTYEPKKSHIIVNWGNGSKYAESLEQNCGKFLNSPGKINIASNKLAFFNFCQDRGVSIPPWTSKQEEAIKWCSEKKIVVCREEVRGTKGEGIVLATTAEQVISAPLYTQYIPKKAEYRVHVIDGKCVDVQEKRGKTGVEAKNYKVRSYSNGWVFCREGVKAPEPIVEQAIKAVTALGLDIGAVDIGWNEKYALATVYEVNTAPGLEGTTVDTYRSAITHMLKDYLTN